MEASGATRRTNRAAWRFLTWLGVGFMVIGVWATTLAFSHPVIWVDGAAAYFVGVVLLVNGLLHTRLMRVEVPR